MFEVESGNRAPVLLQHSFFFPTSPLRIQSITHALLSHDRLSSNAWFSASLFSSIGRGVLFPLGCHRLFGRGPTQPSPLDENAALGGSLMVLPLVLHSFFSTGLEEDLRNIIRIFRFLRDVCSSRGFEQRSLLSRDSFAGAGGLVCSFSFL